MPPAAVEMNEALRLHLIDGVTIGSLGSRASSALGPTAPLADSTRVPMSVIVADTADMLSGLGGDIAGVALAELPAMVSVPSIDPVATNPIGWRATPDPPVLRGDSAGSPPTQTLARAHHVEDWTDPSADAAERAGELAAAAALGAVICIPAGDTALEDCLGSELHGLMSDAERIRTADEHEREVLSIAMRRAALRDHSRRGRAGQVLSEAGVEAPLIPSVSVLVATRRPHRLADVVATLGRQTYPRLEAVVGLHGTGFDSQQAEAQLAELPYPSRTVNVAEDRALGEVLNAALASAQGTLIAKFDDDDEYGPHHLWDLVLAAEFSGAASVGKASEYVYLAEADRTVRRFAGFGERRIDPQRHSVAGGATLFQRDALDAARGWRAMNVGEDKEILRDIAAQSGTVYRTHGSGYLLMRHGHDHTWAAADSYFLEQASDSRSGCDRRFAGVS